MALSPEAPVLERHEARRLVLHGTTEAPQLLVPNTSLELASAIRTEDVSPDELQQSALDASYVLKTIHFKEPEPEPAKPKFELVIVKFDGVDKDNPLDMAEVARKVDRGMDRAKQYEQLVEIITLWEAHIQRGESATYYHTDIKRRNPRPAGLKVTPESLNKLKHVAASMYAGELSQEPASKEFAKGVKAIQVLDEEAIVGQAERIIEEYKKSKNPETAYEITQSTIEETISSPSANTKSANEKQEIPKEAETPTVNNEYPDDSVSDDIVPVEFVQELLSRNF